MPLGLGHLTSLEILSEFVVSSETSLRELKELSNLGGSLYIRRLGHGKDDMVECKAYKYEGETAPSTTEIRVGFRMG